MAFNMRCSETRGLTSIQYYESNDKAKDANHRDILVDVHNTKVMLCLLQNCINCIPIAYVVYEYENP